MSEYFPEPKYFWRRINAELDLTNYVTKADLKNARGVDRSKFVENFDLRSLKSNVDKLDIDKLKNVANKSNNLKNKVDKLDANEAVPVPVYLGKLNDVVKNSVVIKDVYNAKIKIIEDKIPDITNLATNTTLNAKINEVKGKVPSITDLPTTGSLMAKIKEVKKQNT